LIYKDINAFFAKLIIFIGVSCLIGGGVPQKGFISLLKEYKENIAINQKPSLNQQGAYLCDKFKWIH